MMDIGVKSCIADPDVWLRAAVKPNGDKYYEYVLIYVDDLLVFSEKPEIIINTFSKIYRFKEDPKTKKTWSPPERYLGANIGTYKVPTNVGTSPSW